MAQAGQSLGHGGSGDTMRLLREELVAWSRRGYDRGLVAGVSGNNSLRVPDSDLMLIKTTGCCMGDMDTADTVLMDFDGNVLEEGKQPSKEWRWHLGIYKTRPDVCGIAHFHPPYAVAFAVANRLPPLVHTAGRGHLQRVKLVQLLPSGSQELADEIMELFRGDLRVALMQEHGSIAVGPDLRTACYRSEYLEDNAKVALLAIQVVTLDPAGSLTLAEDTAPLAEVGL